MSAQSCPAEAIKGIPAILHWAPLCNGFLPSSRAQLMLSAINFIKVCWIAEAICFFDAMRTIRKVFMYFKHSSAEEIYDI